MKTIAMIFVLCCLSALASGRDLNSMTNSALRAYANELLDQYNNYKVSAPDLCPPIAAEYQQVQALLKARAAGEAMTPAQQRAAIQAARAEEQARRVEEYNRRRAENARISNEVRRQLNNMYW